MKLILLYSAYLISTLGDWVFKFSIPLYLYSLTGSALQMSFGFALTFLPFILFSLVGDILADRYSKKILMFFLDITAGILVLFLLISPNLIIVYILIFIISSLSTIYHPIFNSFIPDVTKAESLPRVNALIFGSDNFISIFSPLISGSLIYILSIKIALLLNSISFILSAFLYYLYEYYPYKYYPHKFIIKNIH